MSILTRVYLIFGCLGVYGAANSQIIDNIPLGTISGRVTVEGKGVAGVVVGLLPNQMTSRSSLVGRSTTDHDGYYRITRVRSGNYRVRPFAPTFVEVSTTDYSQRGRAVIIDEGEDVAGIDFELFRGGVITGKVSDAEGRPLIEERLKLQPVPNTRLVIHYPPFMTDDRGVYRIYGVAAGRYKVAVGEAENNLAVNSGLSGRRASKLTFHPGVTEESQATVIEVKEGEETSNIDITVSSRLTGFSVTGQIVNGDTGQPIEGARYGFSRVVDGQRRGFSVPGTVTRKRGEFRLEGLSNGQYIIFLPPMESNLISEDLHFEIKGENVSGLVMRTTKGSSLSGVLIPEGISKKAALDQLLQMRIGAYVRSESVPSAGVSSAIINSDGSFHINGLRPGIANVVLLGMATPSLASIPFHVSRIEHGGVVLQQGIEISMGEHISGIKVFVVHASGAVRGKVTFENGTLQPGVRVIAYLRRLGEQGTMFRPQVVDSRGHFIIEGVPAGVYNLLVNALVPQRSGRQPGSSQQVIVTDGSVTEVVIMLDMNPAAGLP